MGQSEGSPKRIDFWMIVKGKTQFTADLRLLRGYSLRAGASCFWSGLALLGKHADQQHVLASAASLYLDGYFPGTGVPAAHARARYRCFLPDLAGLAGLRCA